jgi:serine/threonine protein kinase
VWSLGCVLFYMITKKDPFDGKDPNEIKFNILNVKLETNSVSNIPLVYKPLLEACFTLDDTYRVTSN